VQFEVRYCDTSSLALFLKIAVDIEGLLCFHMNFCIDFSISVENVMGILVLTALNLQIAFSTIAIFAILIPLIHEDDFPFSNVFDLHLQSFIVSIMEVFHFLT
jgi:hypothetical protein